MSLGKMNLGEKCHRKEYKIPHVDHCQKLYLFLFCILSYVYLPPCWRVHHTRIISDCLFPVSIKTRQKNPQKPQATTTKKPPNNTRCFLEPLVYLTCRNEGPRPIAKILLPLQTQIWANMMTSLPYF